MTVRQVLDPTTQAYGELQAAFVHYNDALFDGQLPFCIITMQREKRTYGYFSAGRFLHRQDKSRTDEIAMNPSYFGVIPLLEILQTLVHEMVHSWQHHFGDPGRRAYHNKEWAAKMEAIGLMPSSTGQPGGAKTGEKMADYPIEDGPFMKATADLLTTNFKISWVDRFTPSHAGIASMLTGLDGGEDDDGSEGGELAGLLSPMPAGSRSNRDKYRCPICKAQIWGKPGLRVLCGEKDCKAMPFVLTNS